MNIWKKILKHQGEQFENAIGIGFTYKVVDDNHISIIQCGIPIKAITRKDVDDALAYLTSDKKDIETYKKINGATFVVSIVKEFI